MVSFCESVDANVAIYFDSPGQPMVCSPDFRNRITHFFHGPERAVDFEAELVLATMVDPAAPSHVFEAGEANIEDALAAPEGEGFFLSFREAEVGLGAPELLCAIKLAGL